MTFILPGGLGQLKPSGPSEPLVPAVASTWDPATKSTYAVLSYGNLQLTSSNNQFGSARGTNGRSMGKFYFELNQTAVNNNGQNGFGLCNSNFDPRNTNQFDTNTLVGMDAAGNTIGAIAGGSGSTIYLAFKSGYNISMNISAAMPITFMYAVDLDNGRLFWGARGAWRNPVTGTPDLIFTPGMWFPVGLVYMGPGANGSVTMQIVTSNLSYPVPAGYTVWG